MYDLGVPPPDTYTAPEFAVPPLACDTHAHVVASDTVCYPFADERSYTPAPASQEQYFTMLDALRLQRGVLVQISVYGTDNRLMLETLQRNPDRLRGVAVLPAEVSDAQLDAMHAAGVRGVRINTQLKGGVGLEQAHALAQRINRLGWHMQFFMHAGEIRPALRTLSSLPVPCVLDHMGGIQADTQAALVDDVAMLVRNHGWWVKLSGAYRVASSPAQAAAVSDMARALIAAGRERMLWGTDWPHVHMDWMPDTGALLNQLRTWVDDEATLEDVLVRNPARLYDF
ncbi:amidohydrolase family protein [Verticiella sediminum]|uniref:amidohydrolase family protein n=1 Tax=Verticiella sediminum TaxID=1247510 RepID=UPI001FE490FE|nr:amidohydrolase family protein [Verticiella sediminum]